MLQPRARRRTTRSSIWVVGLCALVLAVAPAASQAATLDVCPSGCTYSTIGAAVTAANPAGGDTITVAAGTYPVTQLLVNKPVVIQGAGVGQSIIDGQNATGLPSAGSIRVDTNAGDVKIDGFTVRNAGGQGASPSLRIAVLLKGVLGTGHTFTFSHNRIEGRGAAGTDYGFDSDNSAMNLVFDSNTVTNTGFNPILIERHKGSTNLTNNTVSAQTTSSSTFFLTHTGDTITAPQVVSGNTFNTAASAVSFNGAFVAAPNLGGGYTNVTISSNTINSGTGSGISLNNLSTAPGGATGVISGATITGNTLTGTLGAASRGINITGLVQGTSITHNQVTNYVTGVRFATSTAGTSSPGAASVNLNRIVSNTTGLDATAGGPINAENNWWGCNGGPGAAGCDPVTGTADYNPWLVLTITPSATGTIVRGTTRTFTAALTTNSDGGSPGTALPDGFPIAFSATGGTVSPSSAPTLAGAAQTVFTAGQSAGPASVSATLDSQTVTSNLQVVLPPCPPPNTKPYPARCLKEPEIKPYPPPPGGGKL